MNRTPNPGPAERWAVGTIRANLRSICTRELSERMARAAQRGHCYRALVLARELDRRTSFVAGWASQYCGGQP